LELSDDSDIEVHPNVDKKSFIRAKQAQIHQQRAGRKHQIATLKYERLINDGFITRIDRFLTALKSHRADTAQVQELVLQSLIESADTKNDKPPTPPEGVYTNTEAPTYSKMMAMLVDHVKKDVDESKVEHNMEAYIKGVEAEKIKVEALQQELLTKVAELEKEDKKHITSDDLHDGFNTSHVSQV
jgi:cell division cycle protein 37